MRSVFPLGMAWEPWRKINKVQVVLHVMITNKQIKHHACIEQSYHESLDGFSSNSQSQAKEDTMPVPA